MDVDVYIYMDNYIWIYIYIFFFLKGVIIFLRGGTLYLASSCMDHNHKISSSPNEVPGSHPQQPNASAGGAEILRCNAGFFMFFFRGKHLLSSSKSFKIYIGWWFGT